MRDFRHVGIYYCGGNQSNTHSADFILLLFRYDHIGAYILKRTIDDKAVSEFGIRSSRYCIARDFGNFKGVGAGNDE